jgi:hypothetical protein
MSWWGANIFTHDLNHPLITKIYFVQNFEHVFFVFWSNTHCSELMNSVGVVAASQCPFTMEVMFWYFVKETYKVITTAILRFVLVLFEQMQNLASHLFVEFSLQSHWHAHSKSRLGLRVWGARSSLWSDNVPSSHLANIYILLDFFIADMGALEAVFSHRCDSTSYSITVRIPHSCVFGCQPLLLALFVCLWAGKGFVNLRQVRMQLFEKRALNPNSYRHYLYILRKFRATGQ